jgi:hypothetical protein
MKRKMDTTTFSESAFVTPDLVKNSATKIAVVIEEAKPEKTDYGEQLFCNVQIDGKSKKWRMNRDSVKNMHQISTDSAKWIGRKVQLMVITSRGKEQVLGVPVMGDVQ